MLESVGSLLATCSSVFVSLLVPAAAGLCFVGGSADVDTSLRLKIPS